MMKRILALLFLCGILVSCTESEGPEKLIDFDRSNSLITVKIVTHADAKGVTESFREFQLQQGLSFDGKERSGWAGWSLSQPYVCEVHVIEVNYVRDKELETWGHELAHCIYGVYHDEGQD